MLSAEQHCARLSDSILWCSVVASLATLLQIFRLRQHSQDFGHQSALSPRADMLPIKGSSTSFGLLGLSLRQTHQPCLITRFTNSDHSYAFHILLSQARQLRSLFLSPDSIILKWNMSQAQVIVCKQYCRQFVHHRDTTRFVTSSNMEMILRPVVTSSWHICAVYFLQYWRGIACEQLQQAGQQHTYFVCCWPTCLQGQYVRY